MNEYKQLMLTDEIMKIYWAVQIFLAKIIASRALRSKLANGKVFTDKASLSLVIKKVMIVCRHESRYAVMVLVVY